MYDIAGRNSLSNSSCRKSSVNQPRESKYLCSLRKTTPLISPSLKLSGIGTYLFRFEIQLVCPCIPDEVRRAQQTLKRSRVGPPAFELFPRHRVALDVSVVDVGDLELAAT